jgi:aldose 1-epimerase
MGNVLYPQPCYLFSLDLRVEYTLSSAGLTVRATATNVGEDACLYGSGAHPYLTVGMSTVDSVMLTAPGRTVILSDERAIPKESLDVAGTPYDFREPRVIGETILDNAFTDLERGAEGRARVELRDERSTVGVALWLDETYDYVMLFTGDPLPDVNRPSECFSYR